MPRRRRRVRYGAALLACAAVAGYVTFRAVTAGPATVCTVRGGGGRLDLRQQQAANAATIGAVAASRDLPERALTIALATAMQESKLRNMGGGDRDSLGLFQQRPSQGWGTAEQIADPVYSANEFFDQLVRIPGYSRLPLTVAAQRVQRSGYPRAYARHEADAALLAAALSGRAPALSCTVLSRPRRGDAAAVRQRLAREFGAGVLADGGGPVAVPADGSPPGAWDGARDGRVVVVPGDAVAGPAVKDPAAHGWVLAQWAVAHAPELRIAQVDYRGRRWRAADSGRGWTSAPVSVARYGDVAITVTG
ncbi:MULTISPECIES: hypothetical protein [Streptomycetaceae]|uniref:Heavy metal transporter n=1 Tax=Streptantibioticus cattleyicolor (strain ATCC 35852 / DSM 46488 / JCM 4925 / NBRC 14057 / NRRL 8057) TaxID=1003195 RepID=F8K3M9_STREN|nr:MULTISPECIES: hypothetical protein [Streptomycetaceae]AEW96350.1 hypothetical protein SCATT_39790 [Streptantibioticus cattleyicolor NRRL 8057 = DSM 46488]MYS60865.1 hypothetical protein [Streptomyces sp. SID5468]CCB76690.1 putative membrane protein [Streptantibioticus cattleyicolor NRRL 8057 = DSM 46488]